MFFMNLGSVGLCADCMDVFYRALGAEWINRQEKTHRDASQDDGVLISIHVFQ